MDANGRESLNHGWTQSGKAATEGARLCEPQRVGSKGRVGWIEALAGGRIGCGSQTSCVRLEVNGIVTGLP